MNNLISVIVPIYKVEPYLRQCVDSIINQTYKNLEIILVDDGSPDGCPQICDDYAAKDTRVKVIHKENGGLSSARNAGLDIASGDYIAFVDSDDFLVETMYQDLLEVAESHDADVTACDAFEIVGENRVAYSKNNEEITVINKTEDFFLHIVDPFPWIRFEVWNKLFKKKILSKIRFKEGQIYEDMYFDRLVFSHSSVVVHLSKSLYCYRLNRKGSTNSTFKSNRFCFFDEINSYLLFFNASLHNEELLRRYAILGIDQSLAMFVHAMNLKAKTEFKLKLIEIFGNYFRLYGIYINKWSLRFFRCLLFRLNPYFYYYFTNPIRELKYIIK